MKASICDLYIYPIKSLAGIKLTEAKLSESGLEGDRQWAIGTDSGHILTQRQEPRLVLIQPEITSQGLILHAPGMPSIHLSTPTAGDSSVKEALHIWKDKCWGVRTNREANEWLNDFLKPQQSLTLFHAAPQVARQFINPARFNNSGHYFSDAAPYLIASRSSLNHLNTYLLTQDLPALDMRNFRPNIVIDYIDAFAEQRAKFMAIENNKIRLKIVDACQRCAVISVIQETGEFRHSTEYIQAITRINPMPANAKAPAFGMNCSLDVGADLIIRSGQHLILQ